MINMMIINKLKRKKKMNEKKGNKFIKHLTS